METSERPIVIAVSGLKNSGKTALIEAMIPLLAERGVKTAVIKHHGHGFGAEIPDRPGTDTYRFLAAGAFGTVIYDDGTVAMVKRCSASAAGLAALFPEADLIIIEGAKDEGCPRIQMLREGHPLTSAPETILFAVTDAGMDTSFLPDGVPAFAFGDFAAAAAYLINLYF